MKKQIVTIMLGAVVSCGVAVQQGDRLLSRSGISSEPHEHDEP